MIFFWVLAFFALGIDTGYRKLLCFPPGEGIFFPCNHNEPRGEIQAPRGVFFFFLHSPEEIPVGGKPFFSVNAQTHTDTHTHTHTRLRREWTKLTNKRFRENIFVFASLALGVRG